VLEKGLCFSRKVGFGEQANRERQKKVNFISTTPFNGLAGSIHRIYEFSLDDAQLVYKNETRMAQIF
jgi:hypothetical protein